MLSNRVYIKKIIIAAEEELNTNNTNCLINYKKLHEYTTPSKSADILLQNISEQKIKDLDLFIHANVFINDYFLWPQYCSMLSNYSVSDRLECLQIRDGFNSLFSALEYMWVKIKSGDIENGIVVATQIFPDFISKNIFTDTQVVNNSVLVELSATKSNLEIVNVFGFSNSNEVNVPSIKFEEVMNTNFLLDKYFNELNIFANFWKKFNFTNKICVDYYTNIGKPSVYLGISDSLFKLSHMNVCSNESFLLLSNEFNSHITAIELKVGDFGYAIYN